MNSDNFTPDPWVTKELRKEAEALVGQLSKALNHAVADVDDRIPMPPDPDRALEALKEPLPDSGIGAKQTLEQLLALQESSGTNTAGPRCYHFVIGGNTPAAHGADLIAAAFDVITYSWILSPVGVRMEAQALDWLKELLGLPASMSGVMVTGGTMANFVGLAAARQWWGEQLGFDVSKDGLAGKPQIPVLTSGYVHAATKKVLATQGVGRDNIQQFCADEIGRIDLVLFEDALEKLEGAPALVIINAGEVNAGDFDPMDEMMSISRKHNCWVHVDGAFGLFAAVSPRTASWDRKAHDVVEALPYEQR